MKKLTVILTLVLLLFLQANACAESQKRRLIVFFSPSCHACANLEKNILPGISQKYAGKVLFEHRDITEVSNYKFLLSLKAAFNQDETMIAVPLLYFEGAFLLGPKSAEEISAFIEAGLKKSAVPLPESLVDLYERFRSFRPLVIYSAALIDGINPCAFTVIVFFMSFLILQGYRRRELVAIGLAFIFAVFLTYFLIGLGIFQFLYRLKGFFLFSRIVNIAIGSFSVALGFFAMYDFYKFRKTGRTEEMTLQLPKAVKSRIHALVGEHYRRSSAEKEGEVKRNISGLVLSAFITGFLVSLLEAVCTGQTYLPTLVFILKAYRSFKAFAYLLAYNLLFITPLIIVFLFTLLGATSRDFSKFMEKHMGLIKALMALLFFALGAFLIWRA